MRRVIPYLFLIVGICLSLTAMLVMAQEDDEIDVPEPPEYAGTRECRDCHRALATVHSGTAHALTMVEVEDDVEPEDSPVVADFSAGEDVRTVTFPDDETRAFTQADVAYTLGAGRHVQTFLYEAGDEMYYVLPARWNVAESAWQPLDLAENWPDDAFAFGPNCAGCHTVGLDTNDYEWEEAGVMCEACHGPGLDHVEFADDAGGTIDDEERAEIYGSINIGLNAAVCGQCHVRGLANDGIHPYPVDYYPNVNALADVFTPVAIDDEEYWWPTGHARLSYMQYNEWLTSAHPDALASAQGSDAFAAECMNCHSVTQQLVELRLSNRDIDPETVDPLVLAEENPFGITCASCHDPHRVVSSDEAEDTDTFPAHLRQDQYTLCVQCHSATDVTEGVHYPVREVFEGITLIEEVEVQPSPHFTAEDGPTCTTCHMPAVMTYNGERRSHTFDIITPGSAIDLAGLQDTCSGCHEESPAALQQLIDTLQTNTQQRISEAREAADDSDTGIMVALSVVENEGSYGIHNFSYTDTLLKYVESSLGLQAAASLTEAEVSAEIDAVLPDVEPVSTMPDAAPDITGQGLAGASIAILVLAALILVVSSIYFFRSNN